MVDDRQDREHSQQRMVHRDAHSASFIVSAAHCATEDDGSGMTNGAPAGTHMFYPAYKNGSGELKAKVTCNPEKSGQIAALNVAEYRDGGSKSEIGIPYSNAHAKVAIPMGSVYNTLKQYVTNAPPGK